MTKVYVAESGMYEQRAVAGVFDTPERAIAAMPGIVWTKTTWTRFPHRLPDGGPDLERPEHWVSWENEDDGTVLEFDLVADGPERRVDNAVVQTWRPSDGHWDYVPETVAAET